MLQSMIAGGCAGILAKTVIAPAERVKMAFQTTKEVFTLRGALTKAQSMVTKGGFVTLAGALFDNRARSTLCRFKLRIS